VKEFIGARETTVQEVRLIQKWPYKLQFTNIKEKKRKKEKEKQKQEQETVHVKSSREK
tara:strand:+ start:284 stop:457 length:174 start_codon:yes stop_codon:yes gene_type:complete